MTFKPIRILLILCVLPNLLSPATAQAFGDPAPQTTEATTKVDQKNAAKERREKEKQIDERSFGIDGIDVGEPKVYDDSLLQQMLNAAQARLMSLQILDQSGIAARLGALTGATQSITSFGLSVQGSPLPQIATTKNGATDSTGTTNQTAATTSATPSTTTTNTSQNTAGAPVTNVTTTSPQVAAPTVTPPAASTSLPSAFSVSASDILNEQMQLTYEIANLRLLLEGSLSDRVLAVDDKRIVKPRVTLGFPIALQPDKRYKNAVAVVEVEIEKSGEDDLKADEPPSIIALLPREKTYNVASITDKSVAISAGVVTQVASVAGSFFHGTKTYYMVQDQDTLALTFRPADAKRVGFIWQFRPVLGAKYVKSGLKLNFVQLAFPSDWSAKSFGRVHVRTYWQCYDRHHSLIKNVRHDSLREYKNDGWPISNFTLEQGPKNFSAKQLEDIGNGQMLVTVVGRFLGGTYVRVGSNLLHDGSPSFTSEYQQIRFVASIADLATKQVKLVARDGTENSLNFKTAQFEPKSPLKIASYALTALDDQNTQLTVELESIEAIHDQLLPLIFVIGPRVFGYSDAPIQRNGNKLSVIVPTAFLIANPKIIVKALFTQESYWKDSQVQLSEFAPGAQAPKLSVLESGADFAKFLLTGSSLNAATVVAPAGVMLETSGLPTTDNLRSLTLNKDQVKNQKLLVLKMTDGLLFEIPIPSVELPDTSKPTIKPVGAIVVGTDEVVFQGNGLSGVEKVVFNGIELKLRKAKDGKTVWVKGLRAAGVTTEAKSQALEFYLKSGKTVVNITVIPSKPA